MLKDWINFLSIYLLIYILIIILPYFIVNFTDHHVSIWLEIDACIEVDSPKTDQNLSLGVDRATWLVCFWVVVLFDKLYSKILLEL